ncbi:hypothetical protein Tco_1353206, partial [Tanacetum coccineum]
MVAIAIYKGNLHRKTTTNNETQEEIREWIMPVRTISPKDFKTLIHRRNKALSTRGKRLRNPKPDPYYNPNPNSYNDNGSNKEKQEEEKGQLCEDVVVNDVNEKVVDQQLLIENGGELVAVTVKAESDVKVEEANGDHDLQLGLCDRLTGVVLPKNDTSRENEERKKEIEEKLKILNERKHKLVQVLKQILNAEEELRRRSNVQGISGRPIVSLQVDVTNDSGSMSRDVTPRPGSEGNCVGDVEGADADGVPNQNLHSRNMTRMSSMSPSSDSLHRRGPFSMEYYLRTWSCYTETVWKHNMSAQHQICHPRSVVNGIVDVDGGGSKIVVTITRGDNALRKMRHKKAFGGLCMEYGEDTLQWLFALIEDFKAAKWWRPKSASTVVVPNPSRGTLGVVAGSPSRFAPTPTGQQVNPGSLPTVSVTGTNYVASSPSPAGSGGTSVFRDKLTSFLLNSGLYSLISEVVILLGSLGYKIKCSFCNLVHLLEQDIELLRKAVYNFMWYNLLMEFISVEKAGGYDLMTLAFKTDMLRNNSEMQEHGHSHNDNAKRRKLTMLGEVSEQKRMMLDKILLQTGPRINHWLEGVVKTIQFHLANLKKAVSFYEHNPIQCEYWIMVFRQCETATMEFTNEEEFAWWRLKYPLGFTPKEGSKEIGMYAEESKSVNFVNLSGSKAEEANKDGHGILCECLPSGNDLLIIAVYAAHDCRDKQMLWDYLTYEIGKWKWEVVIMGDFNESKILGVNVDSDKVKGAASKLGCLILKTPFMYRVHAWTEMEMGLGELGVNVHAWKVKTDSLQRGLMFHAEVLILIPLCVLFVIMGWRRLNTCSSIVAWLLDKNYSSCITDVIEKVFSLGHVVGTSMVVSYRCNASFS